MADKYLIPCPDAGQYRKFGWYDTNTKVEDRRYHVGSDRNTPAETNILTLLAGTVIFSDEVNGFGSYDKKGGVVIIESRFNNELYSILYGHIVRHLNKGEIVTENEVVGEVIKYFTANYRADHLHWGVWKGGGIPTTPYWGYNKEVSNWIDPDKFLALVMRKR